MFNNLKTHLNVEDNPRSQGSLRYSWDNQRMDGTRILARLDRIYLFPACQNTATRNVTDYRILGSCPWSDHHPVTLNLALSEGAPRKSRWIMNTGWLEEAGPLIEATWCRQQQQHSFFAKIKAVEHVYRQFCKQKATIFKQEEQTASAALEQPTQVLQHSHQVNKSTKQPRPDCKP